MTSLLINIYRYFKAHRMAFYLSQAISLLCFALLALGLRFDGDIMAIFPKDERTEAMIDVFDNLKIPDRIVIMFTDSSDNPDYGMLEDAAWHFVYGDDDPDGDVPRPFSDLPVSEIMLEIDNSMMTEGIDFVFRHLPVFMEDADYARLDSLLAGGIPEQMDEVYSTLTSPTGAIIKNILLKDPLGMSLPVLSSAEGLNPAAGYDLIDNFVFSPDGHTLLCFITPEYGTGSISDNENLVDRIESRLEETEEMFPDVKADYFGAPAVGVHNARQIKLDTVITSLFAIVVIALLVTLAFRRRWTLLPILFPVLYGFIFALAGIRLIQGSISSIAVGTGAIVLGIALSYSIHVVTHQRHCTSIEQLIRETAFPMTVGSLTTIGAFLGLLFTGSTLLRDFGLFSSLTLVGTTFYSLVFLPGYLKPMGGMKETWFMRRLDAMNAYPVENSRLAVGVLALLFVIGLCLSGKVGFNADMMSLNFMPRHLAEAQHRLESFGMQDDQSGENGTLESIMFVSRGATLGEAAERYASSNRILDSLMTRGLVKSVSSAERFIIPYNVQQERLDRWKAYWTEDRREEAYAAVDAAGVKVGFKPGAFRRLREMLSGDYSPLSYPTRLLENNICLDDNSVMLVSTATLSPSDKETVYTAMDREGTVIFDRSYLAGKELGGLADSLDLILLISSLIVFIGLCLSYRRLETAVLSFIPMLTSWVMILGLMAVTGMEFNIVNIIICTFIFGIGDDFSIFVTDGLTERYATGRDLLSSHKTAIFFSSFTILAGMGAMIAARHPALHSVGTISLVGMLAVVLSAYTLQPFLFKAVVSGPAARGKLPYTFAGTATSLLLWTGFVLACIFTILAILLVFPLPMSLLRKQRFIRKVAYTTCRLVIRTAPVARELVVNPEGEDLSRPAIVVSNHQSFLDIVWFLALNPKLLLVAKGWVRRVPVFYPVARFLGFYYSDDGYEKIAADYAVRLKDGWSLAIFPEGTREDDGRVHRFHKGAFYIAAKTGTDILPVVMYGGGMILPKNQPLNIAYGLSVVEFMPRISPKAYADGTGGTPDYRRMAKDVRNIVSTRYREMGQRYSTLDNPYFAWMLRRSMVYKGYDAERETRRLLANREALEALDRSLPKEGPVVIRNCGMGQTAFLMKMLSPGRQITATDPDERNIDIARNNVLNRMYEVEFKCE